VVLTGLTYWTNSPVEAEPEYQPSPHLREWFHPEHRVKRQTAEPVGGEGTIYLEGLGWIPKEQAPAPGSFTKEWLDREFTHYMQRDAFFWAAPKARNFAADGKIGAGIKVIFGEEVNGTFLICTRTSDNRVMNMFIDTSKTLRERSQGPPDIDDD